MDDATFQSLGSSDHIKLCPRTTIDLETGTFTAPGTGLYEFSFSGTLECANDKFNKDTGRCEGGEYVLITV